MPWSRDHINNNWNLYFIVNLYSRALCLSYFSPLACGVLSRNRTWDICLKADFFPHNVRTTLFPVVGVLSRNRTWDICSHDRLFTTTLEQRVGNIIFSYCSLFYSSLLVLFVPCSHSHFNIILYLLLQYWYIILFSFPCTYFSSTGTFFILLHCTIFSLVLV